MLVNKREGEKIKRLPSSFGTAYLAEGEKKEQTKNLADHSDLPKGKSIKPKQRKQSIKCICKSAPLKFLWLGPNH